jgi:hypothetical protein
MFQSQTGRGPAGEKIDEELQLLSASDDVPSLPVLYFRIREKTVRDHPNCLEFISSLQEISVNTEMDSRSFVELKKMEEALKSGRKAQVHPNHLTLRVDTW